MAMGNRLAHACCLVLLGVSAAAGEHWADAFAHKHSDPRLNLYERAKGSPGWSYTYPLRAYLSMYRATGELRWLDCLVVRIDNLLEEMRDVPDWLPEGATCWDGYRDGFQGWGTVPRGPDGDIRGPYDEFIVHDGHVCVPIARFVKCVYQKPELVARYKEQADRYLRVLESHVVAKWFASWEAQRGQGVSLRDWGGIEHAPHNQYLAFGRLLLALHEIAQLPMYVPAEPTFPPLYRQRAEEMARFFQHDLRYSSDDDAYLWDYMKGGRREDTGHANLDIEFAIRAFHQRIVFDATDMRRFANTFLRVLWNGNEEQPEFRSHIARDYGREIGDSHLMRWLWLYEFDPMVGVLVNRYYRNDAAKSLSEAQANLACWAVGVLEDD